jgi:S1-C subfamily serine protease
MVDIIIIGLVIAVAVAGYRRGALLTSLAMVAVLMGGILGAAIGYPMGIAAQLAFIMGGVAGLLYGIGLNTWWADVLENRERVGIARQIDRASGAVLSGTLMLMLAWFAGVVASLAPAVDAGSIRMVRSSKVIGGLLGVVSPTGQAAAIAVRTGLVPGLDGPLVIVDEPDDSVTQTPAIAAAATKVVRITGQACGQRDTGTGWPIGPNTVVTNAHVVAGHEWTSVTPQDGRDPLLATIVAFDPANDVAILSVPGLNLAPLPVASQVKHGESMVVVGYPRRDGLVRAAARFDRVVEFNALDIYTEKRTEIPIFVFRGDVHSGNSGSPIFNLQGAVVGTVSAQALGQSVVGGYGIPMSVVGAMASRAGIEPVSPGPCIKPPEPTEL